MKSVRTMMIVALAALFASAFAIAQTGGDKSEAPPGQGPRGGHGPGPAAMLDNLLPPRILDELKLTADQKSRYDALQASFKKEADAWKTANPTWQDQMRKAREDGDRDAMRKLAEQRKPVMDARKANVDKFRETLTAEQKETLDKAMEQARGRRRPGPGPGSPSGEGPGAGGPKGGPPPPAD
jgi:Spy/CpxP family protein refolding chaperone